MGRHAGWAFCCFSLSDLNSLPFAPAPPRASPCTYCTAGLTADRHQLATYELFVNNVPATTTQSLRRCIVGPTAVLTQREA